MKIISLFARNESLMSAVDPSSQISPAKNLAWNRLAAWGEYPQQVLLDGEVKTVLQVVDEEGAQEMIRRFNTALRNSAHLGKGLPIYEGHPDDSTWRAENPAVKEIAFGRVKGLEIREDGVWMQTAFTGAGVDLVRGESPAYSGHSPHWNMMEIPGSNGQRWRVVELLSVGLVNRPNIPGSTITLPNQAPNAQNFPGSGQTQTNQPMNPELLKRLGLKPEASQESIEKAIADLLDDLGEREEEKKELSTELESVNAQLKKHRDALIDQELTSAVNDGRIPHADREKWLKALNADLDGELAKLKAKMPTTSALNTQNHVGDQGNRRGEGSAQITLTNALRDYAKANGLDLSNSQDYDHAFAGLEAAKPELFARK